jgi:hypothetical protein
MSNMANITVKKADGATDIVFDAMSPSAGDKSPAFWRAEAVSAFPGRCPTLSLSTQNNGPATARVFEARFTYPVFDEAGVLLGKVPMTLTGLIPNQISRNDAAEAVHQGTGLMSSALVREALKTGYSPK